MYRYLFFDLDGTLTDSKEGILKSLRYAFDKLEDPAPDEETLTQFIGPPLQQSFQRYCGYDAEKARLAIRLFRERYVAIGKYENAAAPGLPEVCAELRQKGYVLALSSSKPEELCRSICRRFGYEPSLSALVGSPLTGDWSKEQIIRETFRRLGLDVGAAAETLMVGDRSFDVEGAAGCGVDCVGVEFFGYAQPGELERAGAVAVVRSVPELREFIRTHGAFA